jgi:Tn3 transposase DDE domain
VQLTSVASREITDSETAPRRKLLVSFGIGSNIAIKRIADAIDGHRADTEAALRRFRRIYFNRDGLRRAIAEVVNKTLEVRPTSVSKAGARPIGSWCVRWAGRAVA